MNNMNVIIADDHPIVLFGIRKSLEQIEWVNVEMAFDVFDQGDPIAIFVARHRQVGNQNVRVKLRI
jgi:DNA-binding NarL/FixJ family response regulator